MKERGMDYVTVTDHNCWQASKYLSEKYPEDCFTGTEATAYFPEDGCKVHILIYGFNEKQFNKIQKHRRNIYKLRDYIREHDLPYSVAHATYSVNHKLKMEHLERLILLFDVFEGINGARGRLHNNVWVDTLESLTPEKIDRLKIKYPEIQPMSDEPWVKGFTGGSDDHGGLFLGKTYTVAKASSPKSFLKKIAEKNSYHSGRYADFHSLAFSIYKIAYDFSKSKKSMSFAGGILNNITSYIFEQQKPGILNRIKLKTYQFKKRGEENRIKRMVADLVYDLQNNMNENIDKKLNLVFHKASDIADEMIKVLISAVDKDVNKINFHEFYKGVTSMIPAIFLSLPFFSSFNHMYKDRSILDELESRLPNKLSNATKRILWFTDTIKDLNGVSVTLRTIGWLAYQKGYDIKFVTCLPDNELDDQLPPNIMNLKVLHDFSLPYYEKQKIRIPSVLKALEEIYAFEPDEVYISTPGPVGMTGLLASKLLHVKSTSIYHTDFTKEVAEIAGNESLTGVVESYTHWFFDSCSVVKATSPEYQEILADRGIDSSKIGVFNRGIDANKFTPRKERPDVPFTMTFAGRVSKDKNMNLLFRIYEEITIKHGNIRLIIAGDGPYMDEVKRWAADKKNVKITGELKYDHMADVYRESDLFVFPSNTDTFGMVVLEAQASGVPAVVSDMGGPCGIVSDGMTAKVVEADNLEKWVDAVSGFIEMFNNERERYDAFRRASRERVMIKYNWDSVFKEIFNKTKHTEIKEIASIEPINSEIQVGEAK